MSVQIHFALLDTATALTFDTTLSTVLCFGFTVSAIDAEGILLLCFSMPVHFSRHASQRQMHYLPGASQTL